MGYSIFYSENQSSAALMTSDANSWDIQFINDSQVCLYGRKRKIGKEIKGLTKELCNIIDNGGIHVTFCMLSGTPHVNVNTLFILGKRQRENETYEFDCI